MPDQIADREVPELMPRTHNIPLRVRDSFFAELLWLTHCTVCVSTQRVLLPRPHLITRVSFQQWPSIIVLHFIINIIYILSVIYSYFFIINIITFFHTCIRMWKNPIDISVNIHTFFFNDPSNTAISYKYTICRCNILQFNNKLYYLQ